MLKLHLNIYNWTFSAVIIQLNSLFIIDWFYFSKVVMIIPFSIGFFDEQEDLHSILL